MRWIFSAGSFRDMTRVARLDENMWTELFMENRDFLSEQLDILIENLQKYDVPVVSLEYEIEGIPYIGTDTYQGIYQLMMQEKQRIG